MSLHFSQNVCANLRMSSLTAFLYEYERGREIGKLKPNAANSLTRRGWHTQRAGASPSFGILQDDDGWYGMVWP